MKIDEADRELSNETNEKMKSDGRDLQLGVAKSEEICQEIETEEGWIYKRWPTRVFWGKPGKLRHPYSRMEKPNLKMMSCWYRCKSYRTFKCSARLDVIEDPLNPGEDRKKGWGDHSDLCQKKMASLQRILLMKIIWRDRN